MIARRVVADVGGTRSRFGISAGPGDLSDIRIYPTAGAPSFAGALETYVADVGVGAARSWCGSVCIAAAGPVDDGSVQLTNAAWSISARDVAQQLGGVPVALVNDLEAVGLLLPHLQAADVTPIGNVGRAELAGNRVAVNVGTGFGAATAVRAGADGWAVAAGEAGHMSLAPATAEEAALFGPGLTVEDVVSGMGVGRLYSAVLRNAWSDAAHPADAVFAEAARDPTAARTVALLSHLLGRISGDLVLATAAWDGAFLCGSVARAWLGVGDVGAFRAAFEAKGPMRARMSHVPTFVIDTPEPALLGLTYAEHIAA